MVIGKKKGDTSGTDKFVERYGKWAVVAGASEGLGAAYAHALARRGMDLLLLARRMNLLDGLAQELRKEYGVEVRCLSGDLGEEGFSATIYQTIGNLEIGVFIYNAAYAPAGEFVTIDEADLVQIVNVNVRAPVVLLRLILPSMIARKRGGVVLMSSLAGNQGAPKIATYGATKAFNKVLAEGLWYELRGKGVDVVACCAGAVRTPGYAQTADGADAPGTLDPAVVVDRTLHALHKGPGVIPGFVNQVANWFLGRLVSRRTAITIMAANTKKLKHYKEKRISS